MRHTFATFETYGALNCGPHVPTQTNHEHYLYYTQKKTSAQNTTKY